MQAIGASSARARDGVNIEVIPVSSSSRSSRSKATDNAVCASSGRLASSVKCSFYRRRQNARRFSYDTLRLYSYSAASVSLWLHPLPAHDSLSKVAPFLLAMGCVRQQIIVIAEPYQDVGSVCIPYALPITANRGQYNHADKEQRIPMAAVETGNPLRLVKITDFSKA